MFKSGRLLPTQGRMNACDASPMQALAAAVPRLATAASLDEVTAVAATAAREMTGADAGAVVLREDDMVVCVAEDGPQAYWHGRRLPVDGSVSGWVVTHREPAAITDVKRDQRVPQATYAPSFARAVLVVPMGAARPIGALAALWGEAHEATEAETVALQALAECTTLAIEALQARDRLDDANRRAETDALTGVANRAAWDECLTRLPIGDGTLALLDLDHFKAFNDRHGHLAGDELLQQAAKAWRAALRPGDVLARVGGEEFGIVIRNCPLDRAIEIAERVRRATPEGVTASLGLAQWSGHPHAAMLVQRADAALYAAKASGRDRTRAAAVVS